MEPVIVIILAEMVRDHQHLQIGSQVCLQRSAKSIGVAVVDRIPRDEVLAETVAAFVFSWPVWRWASGRLPLSETFRNPFFPRWSATGASFWAAMSNCA
ncbi:hypothetical protein [uncultured Thalassospira sp.]|uniref:hypothetical protein n=1 Tax=uncultured Thalassospira sp. TaxID=404382 RepID=UPI002591A372|nr:hypothetical protein [uncultured Thalassospira sp.]